MSNQNTPSTNRTKDDNKGGDLAEPPVWENQKCLDHPQFKIDAISVNEEKNEFKLICIKCLLDPSKETGQSGHKLYTMKDLIQKCVDSLVTQGTRHYKIREEHEQIYLNFLTKDYVSEYEQLLENQYKLVENSIRGLIEAINLLSQKYRAHFSKELQNVRDKGDIIKNKIKMFVEENNIDENSQLSSLNDIQEKLASISNREQLHDLMKQMYFRIHESFSEGEDGKRDSRSTVSMIEAIKLQIASIQEREIDMTSIDNLQLLVKRMASQDGLQSILKDSRNNEASYYNAGPRRSDGKMESSRNYSMSSVDRDSIFSPPRTILKDDHFDSKIHKDDAPTAERKIKRRFVEIGSHSLRNLKKEFDLKEDDITNETKEKAVEKMNDWINRRITGYLIFQNTMNHRFDDKTNYKEMGLHMNSVAGNKWKALTEEEKDEYKTLAKYYRRLFRDEIENYESYDDFTTLIERLDIKIKKLRKEEL